MAKPKTKSPVDLAGVSVRRVKDAAERARWDALMDQHHYLGFRRLYGSNVRQVAQTPDGRWVALLGWSSGAFKVGVRDAWIGWAREQQFRRLHLVANNCRFLILPGFHGGNLASRVLALAVRRLCGDYEQACGHPVLLAETFVDPSRFEGTCYRASNWTLLGQTRGYARNHGSWAAHGQPKQMYVRALCKNARTALAGLDEPAAWRAGRACPELPNEQRLRSLYDFLCEVPEYRKRRGTRHRLATVLAIAVAARLAGAHGVTAMAEFAARLTQGQLKAVRAFLSPTRQRLVPPRKTCFHRILSELDPDTLDKVLSRFAGSHLAPEGSLALDGKAKPLSRPGGRDPKRIIIAAIEHGSGVVYGQTASDSAGGEINGVRRLLDTLDITGRTITLDALHSCPKTARLIVNNSADYVMPVKGNRKELFDDVRALDFDSALSRTTVEKAHGRIEQRECAVVPLDDFPDTIVPLPGRRQAFRIIRKRTVLSTGRSSTEVAYGLTSLDTQQAGPSEVLAHNRGHWEIENRLHYVRDVAFDEDRSRVRVGHGARNLASLSNAAISLVRIRGRFQHQPEAHRHYAARHSEALREVLCADT